MTNLGDTDYVKREVEKTLPKQSEVSDPVWRFWPFMYFRFGKNDAEDNYSIIRRDIKVTIKT